MSNLDRIAEIAEKARDSVSGNLKVISPFGSVAVTKPRPADTNSYTAGDVISDTTNSGTATNWVFTNILPAVNAGGKFVITDAFLRVDVASVPSGMSNFRLHLFNQSPSVIPDNSAFDVINADKDKYLGWIEFDTPEDLGSRLWSQKSSINFCRKLNTGSTTLHGVLQTIGSYTPSSGGIKTIGIEVVAI